MNQIINKPNIERKPKVDPIYINWNLFQGKLLLNLNKFFGLLSSVITSVDSFKNVLNLESPSSSLLLNITSKEGKEIQESLKGILVELNITVCDKSLKKIVSIPVQLEPSKIIERSINRKGRRPQVNKDTRERFFELTMGKENKQQPKEVFKELLNGEILKASCMNAIEGVKELLINAFTKKDVKLPPNTTVEDLHTGKYSKSFSKFVSEEMFNEGLLLRKMVEAVFEQERFNTTRQWVTEAKEELNIVKSLLEVALV